MRAPRPSINGAQDISSVTLRSLRSAMAVVPQDCVLFNESVRFNIRCVRACVCVSATCV